MKRYLQDFGKRLSAFLLAWVLAIVSSGPLMASDLKSVLSAIGNNAAVSTSGGGRYEAAGRNIYTTGGFTAKFSTKGRAPSLISITPPSYSAGCGGVSAHFGGFSFISGAQIEQWVRVISQGAIGFVVNLAIKALCPVCEAVLALMQKLAQAASALAMDACRAGERLAAMATDWLPSQEKTTVCGASVSAAGWQTDFLEGIESACNTVSESIGKIQEWINDSGKSAEEKADLAAQNKIGNQTWYAVTRALRLTNENNDAAGGGPSDNALALILLNMVGTTVVAPENELACSGDGTSTGQSAEGEYPYCYYPPRLQPEVLLKAYLCGDVEALRGSLLSGSSGRGQEAIYKNCFQMGADGASNDSSVSAALDAEIWVCADNHDRNTDKACMSMRLEKLTTVLGGGVGFFPQVWNILNEGVVRVSQGQPMSPEVKGLVASTDLPVYQALNVAAVYPNVAVGLMDTMALLIAQSLAAERLNAAAMALGNAAPVKGSGEKGIDMGRLLQAMQSMQAFGQAQIRDTVAAVDLHMMLYAQIAEINRRIQQAVLSGELLASERAALRFLDARAAPAEGAEQGGAQ